MIRLLGSSWITFKVQEKKKKVVVLFSHLWQNVKLGSLTLYSHATTAEKCTKKRVMHMQSWLLLISCRSHYVHRRHSLSTLFLVALGQIPCCRACKSLTSFYLLEIKRWRSKLILGTLRSNDATAMRMPLKKGVCFLSVFTGVFLSANPKTDFWS